MTKEQREKAEYYAIDTGYVDVVQYAIKNAYIAGWEARAKAEAEQGLGLLALAGDAPHTGEKR